MKTRLPTLYIPHGGGPWPWMKPGSFGDFSPLRRYLEDLPKALPVPPGAILVISGHWEASQPTVSTAARPPMLYDYGGFPPETYRVQYPALGDPALAERVSGLLQAAGFRTGSDPKRGFDHGTFVPLAISWPQADVPVVMLSLVRTLDPALHLRMGRALATLRDEGVFILGSGSSYHNMRGFGTPESAGHSKAFHGWLADVVAKPASERDEALTRWADAPSARACHPREEHLLPLMVVAGAAGDDRGTVPFSFEMLGARMVAVQFA